MSTMNRKKWQQKSTAIALALFSMTYGSGLVFAAASAPDVNQVPVVDKVIAGGSVGLASINEKGRNELDIHQNADRMAIDWKSFDVGSNADVNFIQHLNSDIALNRIQGGASQIFGHLNANGTVLLINPNGVLFGNSAQVNVGSIVASTMEAKENKDGTYNFNLTSTSTGSVINEGTIITNHGLDPNTIKDQGGLVALLASNVENKGIITNNANAMKAPGRTVLAAAQNVTNLSVNKVDVNFDGSGKINFAVDGKVMNAAAINSGTIRANGGYVVMTARAANGVLNTVVNNSGTIEAQRLTKNDRGEILLDGGDNGVVEMSGTLDVSGTAEKQNGGNITVKGQYLSIDGKYDANGKIIKTAAASMKADGYEQGGTITTAGTNILVGKNAAISASATAPNGKAATWNINSVNTATISDEATGLIPKMEEKRGIAKAAKAKADAADPKTDAGKSAAEAGWKRDDYESACNVGTFVDDGVLNKALRTMNVAIVAEPVPASKTANGIAGNAADVIVNANIEKAGKADVTLSLQAGRNVIVNGKKWAGDGSSYGIGVDGASRCGKLNVTLKAGTTDTAHTSGNRYGSNIIRADINTHGGDFTVNGGTYFGLKAEELQDYESGKMDNSAQRMVSTQGGDITLNGDVILAVGKQAVLLQTNEPDLPNNGSVTIDGTVNSGNAYTYVSAPGQSWDVDRTEAEKGNSKDIRDEGNSYLATVTSGVEDSAVSASIPGLYPKLEHSGQTTSYEAFVGANTGTKTGEQREWYWVTGPEGTADNGAGTPFYVQTDKGKGTAVDAAYTNWHQGEPNNDAAHNGEQSYLGVNYNSFGGGNSRNVRPAQWDDVQGHGRADGYVKETNLAPSTLQIRAGKDITVKGDIGNVDKLNVVVLDARENVTTKDITSAGYTKVRAGYDPATNKMEAKLVDGRALTADAKVGTIHAGEYAQDGRKDLAHYGDWVDVQALNNVDAESITAGTYGRVIAGHDITVKAIQAEGWVQVASTGGSGAADGGRVTLEGQVKSNAADGTTRTAVSVGTNGLFVNKAGIDAIDTPNGSWQVYSAGPTEDMIRETGTLASGNLAIWNHGFTDAQGHMQYLAPSGKRYIFREQPALTITPNDASKVYGETSTGNGYQWSLPDYKAYARAFKDGDQSVLQLSDLIQGTPGLSSDGFASSAEAGHYAIHVEGNNGEVAGVDALTGYHIAAGIGQLEVTAQPTPVPPEDNPLPQVKPKIDYRNPANLDGNGQYGFGQGNRGGVPGVERVAGLTDAQLPFFKVANKQVYAYGTYDVTETPKGVKLTASAKRLPEPNQIASQYRSLDTDIALTEGSGKFTVSYNGSTLNIYPAEESAKVLLQEGDATHNEELAAKALFTSFNKMGLVLDDLDGVYIHTDATESEAKA